MYVYEKRPSGPQDPDDPSKVPPHPLGGTPPAVKDGELLSREARPTSSGNYSDYRARQLATFEQETGAARAQGLAIRSTADAAAALIAGREYIERRGGGGVTCERLTYCSDGLRVVAYLFHPAATALRKRHPLLIFNRGGALEDLNVRPNTQFGLDRFVREGYVVLGSRCRGNDEGEGRKEFGGADLRDVAAPLTLGRALPRSTPRTSMRLAIRAAA
jgi:dipeptidyl aminopeptidase/acylaminoacyl peptidase